MHSPPQPEVAPPPVAAEAAAGPSLLPPTSFTMGVLLGRTFTVWGRSAHLFVALGLAAHAPLAASAFYGYTAPLLLVVRTYRLLVAWTGIVSTLALVVLELGAVAQGVLQRLRGERPALGAMLGAGLRRWPATLGLVLLAVPVLVVTLFPFVAWLSSVDDALVDRHGDLRLLVALGTLVVAAVAVLLVASASSAAVPAAVAERLGPLRALARSWGLTSGSRWRLFGGYAVLALLVLLVELAILWGVGSLAYTLAPPTAGAPLLWAVAGTTAGVMLLSSVPVSLLMVATAVTYHGLRTVHEGEEPGRLGRVFE